MKNIIMGSVLAIAAVTSLSANAAVSICTGAGAATNGATVTASATSFVKQTFIPKCSANVFLTGDDASATLYKVGAASLKGRFTFGGSSAGGAVSSAGLACATAGACAQSDANAAAAAAPDS